MSLQQTHDSKWGWVSDVMPKTEAQHQKFSCQMKISQHTKIELLPVTSQTKRAGSSPVQWIAPFHIGILWSSQFRGLSPEHRLPNTMGIHRRLSVENCRVKAVITRNQLISLVRVHTPVWKFPTSPQVKFFFFLFEIFVPPTTVRGVATTVQCFKARKIKQLQVFLRPETFFLNANPNICCCQLSCTRFRFPNLQLNSSTLQLILPFLSRSVRSCEWVQKYFPVSLIHCWVRAQRNHGASFFTCSLFRIYILWQITEPVSSLAHCSGFISCDRNAVDSPCRSMPLHNICYTLSSINPTIANDE